MSLTGGAGGAGGAKRKKFRFSLRGNKKDRIRNESIRGTAQVWTGDTSDKRCGLWSSRGGDVKDHRGRSQMKGEDLQKDAERQKSISYQLVSIKVLQKIKKNPHAFYIYS